MQNLCIVKKENQVLEGIVGIVRLVKDLPSPQFSELEITDLNGNTLSHKQVGDRIIVSNLHIAKHFPPEEGRKPALFIVKKQELEVEGIIGILRVPTGYPAYTSQMEVVDLNGNATSGYRIGDKFDVVSGETERYYPPGTPQSVILKDELEALESQVDYYQDEGDGDIADHLDYIEYTAIPQLVKQIAEAEKKEEEEKMRIKALKQRDKKAMKKSDSEEKEKSVEFNKENLKGLLSELFRSGELEITADLVKKGDSDYLNAKVNMDGKTIFTHETQIKR